MSLISIEKNVPIPPRIRNGGKTSIYPWERMDVGDSFVFPKGVKKATAFSLSYRMGKKSNKSFAIRAMTEGVRCWRTA